MKLSNLISVLILTTFIGSAYSASGITLKIEDTRAKTIFESLTKVEPDGAAGHTFKNGKNIRCWMTTADMDDARGKPIPLYDARRYGCSMHIDNTGLITPGN